jgi:hypothetical protein
LVNVSAMAFEQSSLDWLPVVPVEPVAALVPVVPVAAVVPVLPEPEPTVPVVPLEALVPDEALEELLAFTPVVAPPDELADPCVPLVPAAPVEPLVVPAAPEAVLAAAVEVLPEPALLPEQPAANSKPNETTSFLTCAPRSR